VRFQSCGSNRRLAASVQAWIGSGKARTPPAALRALRATVGLNRPPTRQSGGWGSESSEGKLPARVACKSMNRVQEQEHHLALANRQIAELTVQIVRQRVIVKNALDTGQCSEMTESLLDALEGTLRIFEKHRMFLLSCSVNVRCIAATIKLGHGPRSGDLQARQRTLHQIDATGFRVFLQAIQSTGFDSRTSSRPPYSMTRSKKSTRFVQDARALGTSNPSNARK
jgi:hypothetical protein